MKGCNQKSRPPFQHLHQKGRKKKTCVLWREYQKKQKTKQNKMLRMRESVCGEETLNKIENKDENKKMRGMNNSNVCNQKA